MSWIYWSSQSREVRMLLWRRRNLEWKIRSYFYFIWRMQSWCMWILLVHIKRGLFSIWIWGTWNQNFIMDQCYESIQKGYFRFIIVQCWDKEVGISPHPRSLCIFSIPLPKSKIQDCRIWSKEGLIRFLHSFRWRIVILWRKRVNKRIFDYFTNLQVFRMCAKRKDLLWQI